MSNETNVKNGAPDAPPLGGSGAPTPGESPDQNLPPPCPACGTRLAPEKFEALNDEWKQHALNGEMACDNPDCPDNW